jgi:hypothetical protein
MEAATSPRKYRGVAAQLSEYPQTEQTPIDPLNTKTPLTDDKSNCKGDNYWTLINEEKDHEMEAERPTNNRKFVYVVVAFVHLLILYMIWSVFNVAKQVEYTYLTDHCNEKDGCKGCNMVEFNPDNTKYNEEFEITKDYKTEKGSCVFSKTTDPPGCRHSKDRSDNPSKWDSHATPRSLAHREGAEGGRALHETALHENTTHEHLFPASPFDKDGDGEISEEEFIAGSANMSINESEAKKDFEVFLSILDKDSNGEISKEEFLAAIPESEAERMFAPTSAPTPAPTSVPTPAPTSSAESSVPTSAPTSAPTPVPPSLATIWLKSHTTLPTPAPTPAPTSAPTPAPSPPTPMPTEKEEPAVTSACYAGGWWYDCGGVDGTHNDNCVTENAYWAGTNMLRIFSL